MMILNRILRGAPLLLALCALPSRAAAQDTPEAVAQRYYDTFRSGDFAANAALMHPQALEELKTTLTGLAAIPGATEDAEFREMFGVSSIEELRALAPTVLFERVLRNQLEGELRAILASTEVSILGHVMEGDTTAHVVYRMRMNFGGQSLDQVQVMPLQRSEGQWRVLLTGSLAGMMNAMPPERPQ
ncbi:hypothetical protein [Longimicrobium sp.]|uniref:hypothetical protein n=1 Tax=Longimicrobium sp. TaxID=2029185 RepID=UPI003B3A3C42